MIFRERETRSSKQVRLSVDRPDACPWLSSTAEVGVIYIQRGKSEPRRFPRPPSNRVGRGIRQELTGARSRCSSQPRDALSLLRAGLIITGSVRARAYERVRGSNRGRGGTPDSASQPASQPASYSQLAKSGSTQMRCWNCLRPRTRATTNSLTAENQLK